MRKLITVHLTALLIQLPIQIVHGVHLVISETTRAKISSKFRVQFAVYLITANFLVFIEVINAHLF